jgi:hypothetical protein
MTKQDAAELLDLIVERAPQLRAAGILTVELGGAGFTLAPAAMTDDDGAVENDEEPGPSDVLHDPWTHGRPGKDAPKNLTVQRPKI